jgi:hypothetical protein
MRNAFTKSILLAIAAASYGCTGSAGVIVSPPAGGPSGTLSITWTIEGTASPSRCDEVGAANLELAIYDRGGAQVADVFADCRDFSVSVELPEATYDGDVTLRDAADNPVSTTLTLQSLEIIAGTELTSDIDFPSDSIL